jgi:hypothetical protein
LVILTAVVWSLPVRAGEDAVDEDEDWGGGDGSSLKAAFKASRSSNEDAGSQQPVLASTPPPPSSSDNMFSADLVLTREQTESERESAMLRLLGPVLVVEPAA